MSVDQGLSAVGGGSADASPGLRGRPATAIKPCDHETLDRIITGLVTVVPILLLGLAAWQAWSEALRWSDLAVLGLLYVAHRARDHGRLPPPPDAPELRDEAVASRRVRRPRLGGDRGTGDLLGRRPPQAPRLLRPGGRPAQPARRPRRRPFGALRGLYHAHVGWLFIHTQRGSQKRFAPDLLADPVVRFIDRTFFLWALVGLAVPFGLGVAIGGTIAAGLTALLWGGAVRVFVLHHVTYSVNSLCHMFGRRPFDTKDESRNLAWLPCPHSARRGTTTITRFPRPPRTVWAGGRSTRPPLLIRALEKLGLAWDVVRPTPARKAAKASSG